MQAPIFLHHESDRYINCHSCDYCGKANIYTRFYLNRSKQHLDLRNLENHSEIAAFFCYNCAQDHLDKNIGWELYEHKVELGEI